MSRLDPLGIWEVFVPGVQLGCLYKYLIEAQDHSLLYKADPYATEAEMRPGTGVQSIRYLGFPLVGQGLDGEAEKEGSEGRAHDHL